MSQLAVAKRGPYMNEDGDWWVAVEDVASFAAARATVVGCLQFEIPEEGTLRYVGKVRVDLCENEGGYHGDDDQKCEGDRFTDAYHFTENHRW